MFIDRQVIKLDTCEKCKNQLGFDELFCPKCGVRTPKGKKEEVEIPWEEHLSEVRVKIDKAVTLAFEELQKGLKTAKEEMDQSSRKGAIFCRHCGKESSAGAEFCWGCGKKFGE